MIQAIEMRLGGIWLRRLKCVLVGCHSEVLTIGYAKIHT